MSLALDITDYGVATQVFLDAARSVNPSNVDRRVAGGWSARQVIHHVGDSEAQSYARLRRLLAEPLGSPIQGYDEAAWAASDKLGYAVLSVDHSLAIFVAVRAASRDVLGLHNESDLTRYGEHSESGRYTLALWLETYRAHPRAHASQLVEAINS